MNLSKRTDYALRAMVELALVYGKQDYLSTKEIAKRESIPIKFLEQILAKLKIMGYIESRIGPGGGYMLLKNPDSITFGSIIRLFEGDVAPIGCVSIEHPRFCSEKWHCRFHRVMAELRDAISGIIDMTTLADVCKNQPPELLGKRR
jgi:Rrf2 family protein